MSLRNIIALNSIIVVAAAATLIVILILPSMNNAGRTVVGLETGKVSNSPSLTILGVNAKLLPLEGMKYSISPTQSDNSKNYKVETNSVSSRESVQSVTHVSGLRPGFFNTNAKPLGGYHLKDSPLLIYSASPHMTNTAVILSHTDPNGTGNETLQAKNVSYNVKFICGSVSGNEGPLRPGHYDTDISVFNNQGYTVPLLWNAVANNGKSTTTVLMTLQPGTSSGISCNNLLQLFGIQNVTSSLVEGFVVISPQTTAGGIASFSGNTATIPARPLSQNLLSPLTVQVFYSANALLTLPHNITMDKILFSISNDTSSKLPASLLGKKLDVTIQSQLNQISDPEAEIRDLLASKYKISPEDATHLKIQIISVGLGATSMIDDHAISSFQVLPQAGQ